MDAAVVGVIPVAAPPRVRQRLASWSGPVPVVHAGSDAAYVDVGGWCVGVLGPRAAQVPCGLRLPASFSGAPGGDVPGKTGYLDSGTLWLGEQAFRPARSVDVRASRITAGHGTHTANSAAILATPPAMVAEFVRGVPDRDGLDDSAMAHALPGLLGAGPGLTPLGDDVVCGWLALHRATGHPTPRSDAVLDHLLTRDRPVTTLLSATLLDCARHGEVLPEYDAWLRALGTVDETDRLARLRAVGATSGAGLAEGARLALLSLTCEEKVLL